MKFPDRLLILFVSVCIVSAACTTDKPTQTRQQAKPVLKKKNAVTLILKNDCLHCHSIEDRVVGPPYLDISRRYAHQDVKHILANKIKEGGGGLWYGGMMSGHPLLKPEELNTMVEWILSLHEKKAEEIKTKGKVTYNKAFQDTTAGFKVQVLSDSPPYTTIGSSAVIDMKGEAFFSQLTPPFQLKVTGKINVPASGKYFIRLQKTNPGTLSLDGKTIITESENDQEIALDLTPGTRQLSLTFQCNSPSDTLSVSWIAPGGDYYTLIPATF